MGTAYRVANKLWNGRSAAAQLLVCVVVGGAVGAHGYGAFVLVARMPSWGDRESPTKPGKTNRIDSPKARVVFWVINFGNI